METKREDFTHSIFEQLHAIPEIGYQELKTSAFLADRLEGFGFDVTRNIGTTGVLGVLDSGKPGVNFAIRGDMDALSFEIDGKTEYRHACGHDANCAMVLTAAKYAVETGINRGKLSIVFQQAEEKVGAVEMLETGKLDDIDELIGIHLRPVQEAVLGEITPALCHSATYEVEMVIEGKGAHAARPQLGINAIDIAVSIITAVNAIKEDSRIPYSVKATQLNSIGNVKNTLPDKVVLNFDIRARKNSVGDSIVEKVKSMAKSIAEIYGGRIAEFKQNGVPASEHDDEIVSVARKAIEMVIPKALPELAVSGGDDFAYYRKKLGVKTAFIGVGADIEGGLHTPDMKFDGSALDLGVGVLKNIIDLKFNK